MAAEILNEYIFGDMRVRYLTDREEGQTGLMILPADMPLPEQMSINGKLESLVQLKLTGDIYDEAYAMGNSMRNGETVRRLRNVSKNHI